MFAIKFNSTNMFSCINLLTSHSYSNGLFVFHSFEIYGFKTESNNDLRFPVLKMLALTLLSTRVHNFGIKHLYKKNNLYDKFQTPF